MQIKTVTKQDLAEQAAERWDAYYHGGGRWFTSISGNTRVIYKKLKALKETTPAAVDEITGNKNWTKLKCYSCNADCGVVAEIEGALSPRSFQLCKKCLETAIKAIDSKVKV